MAASIDTWSLFLDNLRVGLASRDFWAGLVVVTLFAHSRFLITRVAQVAVARAAFPPFAPRSFTTRFRYWFAIASYMAVFAAIYMAFASLGAIPGASEVLNALNIPPPSPLPENAAPQAGVHGIYAWAATALTAAMPPLALRLDTKLREQLFNFASIPHVAESLGTEVFDAVDGSDADPARVWRRLIRMRDALVMLAVYRRHFACGHVLQWRHDAEKAVETMLKDRRAIDIGLLRQYANFLACAVLSMEGSEHHAREVLNAALKHAKAKPIRSVEWNFSLSHLGAAAVTIALVLLIALVVLGVQNAINDGWSGMSREVRDMIAYVGDRYVRFYIAIPMYVLPLAYAAGMKMFLDDQMHQRRKFFVTEDAEFPPWGYLAIFAGSYFFGCLPLAIYLAAKYNEVMLGILLSYGLAPAVFGVVFAWTSRRHWGARGNGIGVAVQRVKALPPFAANPRLGAAAVFVADGLVHALPVGIIVALAHEATIDVAKPVGIVVALAHEATIDVVKQAIKVAEEVVPPLTLTEKLVPSMALAFFLGSTECDMCRRDEDTLRDSERPAIASRVTVQATPGE